ncbi:N-formylglutamate deformylase [Kangiella sediminilitoris]|uniref:N-formylglutamate amidohydrolase n=1 Tax=Kangiella sediminilitoris TaxID=1144748 RepID=A0A1B3BA45_9GAMM|nr:N-formylglutamate deformylase [Kangiella sediminilitoris]AOE49679.1 N-formylglutamate amidohydrolase [Kangiella sediminilitoris]
MGIESLIDKFQKQQLQANEFNHLAHLKVAWHYICSYQLNLAKEKFHRDLVQLTKALGAEDKYHRSLTDFFLDYLLHVKWYLHTESWAEVESACPLLISDAKTLVGYYYSDEVIQSTTAKESFIEADIMPLDRASLKFDVTDLPVFDVAEKSSPIIVSMPHHGQFVPHDVLRQMTASALDSADTDWYLVRLYDFLDELGVSRINANYSRYLIDLNRDSGGEVLYKGADNTELCPTSTFDLEPLYDDGKEPHADEIQRRIDLYWKPYHQKLQQLVDEKKAQFGYCLLFEAHTIQSHVPRFFDGQLPDFNFGTNEGETVNQDIKSLLKSFETESYSKVINGRFKGGYITRNYANPDNGVFTLQLELSQATYLDQKHRLYDSVKADKVAHVIRQLLVALKEVLDK